MDDVIKDTFKEKNDQIYIEKMILDIENNLDSLKLTTTNFVFLYATKMLRKLSSFFKEVGVEYKMQDLNKMVEEEKTSVVELVNRLLEEKSNYVKSSFVKNQKINDDFSNIVDGSTKKFKENF